MVKEYKRDLSIWRMLVGIHWFHCPLKLHFRAWLTPLNWTLCHFATTERSELGAPFQNINTILYKQKQNQRTPQCSVMRCSLFPPILLFISWDISAAQTLEASMCSQLSVLLTWSIISIIKYNSAGLPIIQDGLGRAWIIRCWPWQQVGVVPDVFGMQLNGWLVISFCIGERFMPVIWT